MRNLITETGRPAAAARTPSGLFLPGSVPGLSGPEAVRDLARKHGRMHTFFQLVHLRDGVPIWAQDWTPNALTDEGEIQMLNVYFTNSNAPAGDFYMGLGTNGQTGTTFPPTLADTNTLANITELTGTSYARIQTARAITTGFTLAGSTMTSVTKTFTAGGTWAAARFVFLCDVASGTAGKLICHAALSVERLLVINDQLNVSVAISLD